MSNTSKLTVSIVMPILFEISPMYVFYIKPGMGIDFFHHAHDAGTSIN